MALDRVNRAVAAIAASASALPVLSHLVLSPDGLLLAAGNTDGVVKVYDSSSLRQLISTSKPVDTLPVQSIAWRGNSELVVSHGGRDEKGVSLGNPRVVHVDVFKGTEIGSMPTGKDIAAAVAVSADGGLLVVARGSRIAFFDFRSGSLSRAVPLAEYEESHSEDVTQLAFHPHLPHYLLSGAEDGLVCVFDTRISGENDAIVSVLSVGSGVTRFGTFGPHGAFAHVVTATGDLSLWNLGTAERFADFPALALRLSDAGLPCSYLVDCCFNDSTNQLWLLAGDDEGRLMWLEVTPTDIKPVGQLAGAHTATIRCAASMILSSSQSGHGLVVFTAGEDGVLQQWAEVGVKGLLPLGKQARPAGVEVRPTGWARRGAADTASAAGGDIAASFGKTAAPKPT